MFQPRLAMFLLRLMPCLPCTYHVCRRSAEPRLDLQAATSSSALGQHICECTSSGYTRGVEIIRNHWMKVNLTGTHYLYSETTGKHIEHMVS